MSKEEKSVLKKMEKKEIDEFGKREKQRQDNIELFDKKARDLPKTVLTKPEKPVAIMTNTLSPNMCESGNPVLRDMRYKKLLLSTQKIVDKFTEREPAGQSQLEKYNNTLVPFESLNLRKALEYLRKPNPASFHGFNQILVECGPSTTVPAYSESVKVNHAKQPIIDFKCDGNPIDTLVLSMFMGNMTAETNPSVGTPFLNIEWLTS